MLVFLLLNYVEICARRLDRGYARAVRGTQRMIVRPSLIIEHRVKTSLRNTVLFGSLN